MPDPDTVLLLLPALTAAPSPWHLFPSPEPAQKNCLNSAAWPARQTAEPTGSPPFVPHHCFSGSPRVPCSTRGLCLWLTGVFSSPLGCRGLNHPSQRDAAGLLGLGQALTFTSPSVHPASGSRTTCPTPAPDCFFSASFAVLSSSACGQMPRASVLEHISSHFHRDASLTRV